MSEPAATPPTRWDDALLAAALVAVDPEGLTGIHVRSRSGAVRDRWLQTISNLMGRDVPIRRIAAGIQDNRLTGGLDIGLTLESGRPVVDRGILACADGGLVILAMAERLEPSAAAIIGMALDSRSVRIERDGISTCLKARFALIALDEGIDDEGLAAPLADRLGIFLDLNPIALGEITFSSDGGDLGKARSLLPSVVISDELIETLCEISMSFGIRSMRISLQLVRAARAVAAMRGSAIVEVEDVKTAMRLVLGLPPSLPREAENCESQDMPPDRPEERNDDQTHTADALRDTVVEAAAATLPAHLLAGLESVAPRSRLPARSGKAGALRNQARRGRAIGTSAKPPTQGARLDILATLRQAAPWQRIRALARGALPDDRGRALHIRKTDFRYPRYRQKTGTTAIFAVDASGSAAVERLSETKGAIELLLAECYVRRDQVALIAFRGKGAETLLEPTRSLVRAKRSLSALPGGGGTPLASGILATLAMAITSAQKGQTVVAVFLTDGRANVGLGEVTAKAQVMADTEKAARSFRGSGIKAIVIDTARRPQVRAEALARELGAEYLALPHGGSRAVAREIGSRMEG